MGAFKRGRDIQRQTSMQVATETQQGGAISRPIVVALAATLVVVGVIAFASYNPSTPTDSAVDTAAYTLAGFEVKKHYKCIFPTCTDFWCDANCNHNPRYCPPTFCKAKPSPAPVPNPAPPPPPPPAPACKKTQAWQSTVGKLAAVKYFGPGACHPTICLGIWKSHKKITQKEMTTSPVLDDQCTNCYCFGCSKEQFSKNCGGVAPTEAACTNSGCCPTECLGAIGNVKSNQCGNCKCSGCAQALFGYNCKGKEIPAACDATTDLAAVTNMAPVTKMAECTRRRRSDGGVTRRRRYDGVSLTRRRRSVHNDCDGSEE